jgi:hypothetical protein
MTYAPHSTKSSKARFARALLAQELFFGSVARAQYFFVQLTPLLTKKQLLHSSAKVIL